MQTAVSDKDLELLSQWIDGELNEVDSRRLQQRIAREPALRQTHEAMTTLNSKLRRALDARGTVPAAICDQVSAADSAFGGAREQDDNVVSFPGTGAAAASHEPRRWPLAVAASLVAAIGVALVTQPVGQQATSLPGSDALVSAALDTVHSATGWAALEDGRQLQPVLSFEHRDGTWCREYLLRTDESDWRGVACREDGRWVTQAAGLESFLDSTNAYRPAGAAESAPVSVFISEHAAGIALGRSEEEALISAGWQ